MFKGKPERRRGHNVQFIYDLTYGDDPVPYSGTPCRILAERTAYGTPGSGGNVCVCSFCGIRPVRFAVDVSCKSGNSCQSIRLDPSFGSSGRPCVVLDSNGKGGKAYRAHPARVVRPERSGRHPRRELRVPYDGSALLQA